MEEQLLLFDDPRKKTNRFASQQDMAEYIEENCRWNKVNFYSVAETAAFLCLSEDDGAERMRRRSYYAYIASNGGGESH